MTEAKLEFNLGDSKVDTIDKAIKAIDNIMYVGCVSSYIRPFKLVRNKVAPNSRNDSHQVLMFITDGLDLSGSARREAKYLRDNKHFEVYAIGKVKVYVHTMFTLLKHYQKPFITYVDNYASRNGNNHHHHLHNNDFI